MCRGYTTLLFLWKEGDIMSTIYTVEGNTSGGSTLVANGGGVAKKSYNSSYSRIYTIWRPKYKSGEALKVAQEALKYVGYLEKKSNSQLEDFKANAGYNNYNMFAPHAKNATGSGVYVNGYAWCDMFEDDMFIRALGVKRAKELLYDWSASCTTSNGYFAKAGATKITDYSKSTFGDVIIFKDSSGSPCHIGIVVTGVESATSNGSTTLTSASSTKYTQSDFIKDVCSILNVKTAKAALEKTITISKSKNSKHALVLPIQKYLKALGYYKGTPDRDFGSLSEDAVKLYQKNVVKASAKNCDGIIDSKCATWKKLLNLS
jgi:hypothetical protein